MSTVKSHTRKTASGKTVTVRQHARTGDAAAPQTTAPARTAKPKSAAKRRGPNPGHAAKLAKKSLKTARKRNKKARAAGIAALALGELVAWLTLQGTGLILMTLGAVVLGIGLLVRK
jgi:hypothetical protein